MLTTNSFYLPKQVIRHLVRYAPDGCELQQALDVVDGKLVARWIIDDTIIWSQEVEEPYGRATVKLIDLK